MNTSTAQTPFVDALRMDVTSTENGMATYKSSLDACVDLFFTLWAMRGQDVQRLCNMVQKAWKEDIGTALRLLFRARDIREGAWERQIFKDAVSFLVAHDSTESLKKNIALIPEYGRWDDLEVFFGTPYENDALEVIKQWLETNNWLCAKWMRRQGKNFHLVRKYLDLGSSAYRKMLVERTSTVETLMALGKREEIEFWKLPSLASARYQKAFYKNAKERYEEYKAWLQSWTEKINAWAVYPYDVIKSLHYGDSIVAEAQRANLPNYLEWSSRRILPMCDVSWSMNQPVWNNKNLDVLDVCLSLGLYISERNIGPFHNAFMTFSAEPEIQYLTWKTLSKRMSQLSTADRDMNTNFEKAMKKIVNTAKTAQIQPEDMPTDILILSDMEFDQASRGQHITAQTMIEDLFHEAWYTVPNIIYWNLASRNKNIPVKFDTHWTALISGFSPSILKALLRGDEMTPQWIMSQTINSERYEPIVV